MTLNVWHKNFDNAETTPKLFPLGFSHVANVTAESIDEAFALTETDEWEHNPGVTFANLRLRPTTLGDVFFLGRKGVKPNRWSVELDGMMEF